MVETALQAQHVERELAADEEIEDFNPIEKLEQFGINKGDIKKAKEGGCHTCESLVMNTKKKLQNIKGLSEAKIEKMIEGAKKLCPKANWMAATEVMVARQRDIVKITTGAEAVNELLGGGVETKAITEIYGEYRTGKTQLCMTLCVTCQLPTELGGGAGKVAYIDSEGSFRPERITPIAERFNLEPGAVLDNIIVARVFTHEHQMDMIVSVAAKMAEEPFKLLIVDSVTSLFRTDFQGRGELSERQQKLGCMLSQLKKLSEEYNVAVVITNQVISDPGGGAMFVQDPKKPVGGHVIAHASTTRLSLRKGKGEQRVVKVAASACLPEAEASFAISGEGVVDYKD